MYCNTIAAVNLGQALLILGFVVQVGVFIIAFISLKKSTERAIADKIDSKASKEFVKEVKYDLNCKIEAMDVSNIRTHAEIRAEVTMLDAKRDKQFDTLREDFQRSFDLLREFISDKFDKSTRRK